MKSEKTKAIGVRIPLSLYEFVIESEPNINFSRIVKRALEDKYQFTQPQNDISIPDNNIDFKPDTSSDTTSDSNGDISFKPKCKTHNQRKFDIEREISELQQMLDELDLE